MHTKYPPRQCKPVRIILEQRDHTRGQGRTGEAVVEGCGRSALRRRLRAPSWRGVATDVAQSAAHLNARCVSSFPIDTGLFADSGPAATSPVGELAAEHRTHQQFVPARGPPS